MPESVQKTVELDAKVDLLVRYTEAKNAREAWGKIEDALRAELESLIGEAEVATVNGAEAITWSKTSTFQTKQFQKDEPELYRFYETDKTVRVLDLERLRLVNPDMYEKYRSRRFVNKFEV